MPLWLALRRSAPIWVVCCTVIGAAPAAAQDDGIWPVPGHNLAGFRYSPLDQINTQNVKKLAVAWTFSLGVLRGQEAAPIVAEDTIFVVTPYPTSSMRWT